MKITLMQSTFIANMFLYAAVYTTANFIKEIYRTKFGVMNSKTSLLDMFTILRIFYSWAISSFTGKHQNHKWVAMIAVISYCSMLCGLIIFSEKVKAYNTINVYGVPLSLFAFDTALKVAESGMLPIMEMLVFHVSTSESTDPKLYGRMRLSNAFGRFIAYLIGYILLAWFKMDDDTTNILRLVLFGTLSAGFLLYATLFNTRIAVKVKKVCQYSFGEAFMIILKSGYGIVLIFISLQGVTRTALTSYQTGQTNKISVKGDNEKKSMKCATKTYLFRCIPEISFGFTTSFAEMYIGPQWMVVIGGFFGIAKGFGYAYMPIGNKNGFKAELKNTLYMFGLEILKAISSAYIGYGCTRLNSHFVIPELRTSAQGLYNGGYAGLGACISGILGYKYIKDDMSKNNEEFKTFFKIVSSISVVGLVPLIVLALKMK